MLELFNVVDTSRELGQIGWCKRIIFAASFIFICLFAEETRDKPVVSINGSHFLYTTQAHSRFVFAFRRTGNSAMDVPVLFNMPETEPNQCRLEKFGNTTILIVFVLGLSIALGISLRSGFGPSVVFFQPASREISSSWLLAKTTSTLCWPWAQIQENMLFMIRPY